MGAGFSIYAFCSKEIIYCIKEADNPASVRMTNVGTTNITTTNVKSDKRWK